MHDLAVIQKEIRSDIENLLESTSRVTVLETLGQHGVRYSTESGEKTLTVKVSGNPSSSGETHYVVTLKRATDSIELFNDSLSDDTGEKRHILDTIASSVASKNSEILDFVKPN